MKLSKADADLFFKLMWALQFYIKQKLGKLPDIKSLEQYIACSMEEKFDIRNQLYADPSWIDAFISDNPQHFSEDELSIVAQWKNFISDDFYIERMLKRYTVFIGSNDSVYGVLGLHEDFDQFFHKSALPQFVKAVLLPFKDQIVYDGLLQGANIFFGGGISAGLKQIYLTAKQNGEIIECLTDQPTTAKLLQPQTTQKDWTPLLGTLTEQAKQLRGGSGQPAVYSPVFSLIKASLELGAIAVAEPNNSDKIYRSLGKIEQLLQRVERSLYR